MRRSLGDKPHRIAKNCPVDQNDHLQFTQAVLLPYVTGALFQEDWQDHKASPTQQPPQLTVDWIQGTWTELWPMHTQQAVEAATTPNC